VIFRSYHGIGASPIHYRWATVALDDVHQKFRGSFDTPRWEWSPDGVTWLPSTGTKVPLEIFGAPAGAPFVDALSPDNARIVGLLCRRPRPPLFLRHVAAQNATASATATPAHFTAHEFDDEQVNTALSVLKRGATPCCWRNTFVVHRGNAPPITLELGHHQPGPSTLIGDQDAARSEQPVPYLRTADSSGPASERRGDLVWAPRTAVHALQERLREMNRDGTTVAIAAQHASMKRAFNFNLAP